MIASRQPATRRGAVAVESAIVMSVMFLLLMGVIVLGMGIFRYQELAFLAREGARYASVHGTGYASDTGNAAATATTVYTNAIQPNMVCLNSADFIYSVTWSTSNAPYHTVVVGTTTTQVANTVTVTVSYQWIPEAYFGGVTMTSTSVMPMSN